MQGIVTINQNINQISNSKSANGIGIVPRHKRTDSKRKKEKKKNKTHKPSKTEGGHKVNCSAWGCQCMVKAEKKKKPVYTPVPVPEKPKIPPKTEYNGLDYGNKKVER